MLGNTKGGEGRYAISNGYKIKKNYRYDMEIVFCCFETNSFDFIFRYLHNWKCDENRRSETQGLVFHCQKLQFYLEDEKLMAEMSVRERIEYRCKLKEMKNRMDEV